MVVMMMQLEFEELSRNETYVVDVLQDNNGILASFMSMYDRGNCSSSDVVAAPEFYGQAPNDHNVVQTVEETVECKCLF